MITVTVKLFAGARDIVGINELPLSFPRHSLAGAVLDALEVRHPRLTEWKPYLKLAVNHAYAPLTHMLEDGDEIAVIPPVSGG